MFKKKDQDLLAEAYEIVNRNIKTEGIMSNLFNRKKTSQSQQPQGEGEQYSGPSVKINIGGKYQELTHSQLIDGASKDEVKSIPGGGTKEIILGLYKTFYSNDPNGYGRDVDAFVPVVWLNDDNADYPRSPIAFGEAGEKSYESREQAIQAGMEIIQRKYKK